MVILRYSNHKGEEKLDRREDLRRQLEDFSIVGESEECIGEEEGEEEPDQVADGHDGGVAD